MNINSTSNSLIIGTYNKDQQEDYMNIAKQGEENYKTQKFVKFKPRNSTMNACNLLKGEENKLKTMLFSLLKNEETKIIKDEKSLIIPNNKLSSSNLLSSVENKKQIKKSVNKNYKQLKKKPKNLGNFTSKNINSNKCLTSKRYKKNFQF